MQHVARDALPIVLSVRRRAVDHARAALGICLSDEADVADRLAALEMQRQQERLLEDRFTDRSVFLDVLSAGHQRIQAERDEIIAALQEARAKTAEARTAVVEARQAAEAVEKLINERAAARAARDEKQAQHALDDLAGLLRARRRALAGRRSAED